jgi:hypothetical protein
MSDADETERIPLHEGVGVNSPSMAARRWPMLLLGAVVGLLSAAAIGGLGGKPLLGSAAIETTCGAVPTITHPPLVRRTLDATVRNVLVTGGAGFIASHFALALLDRGNYNVTIVDDLSRGSIDTVPSLAPASRPQPHAPAATPSLAPGPAPAPASTPAPSLGRSLTPAPTPLSPQPPTSPPPQPSPSPSPQPSFTPALRPQPSLDAAPHPQPTLGRCCACRPSPRRRGSRSSGCTWTWPGRNDKGSIKPSPSPRP